MHARTEREILIDALRGFALFGILIVNIQSFAWGVGAPTMGVLWEDATWRDEATIWLTAFIFEYKIYPLFCFCFGYGFAVMAKRWRYAGLDTAAIQARFSRRLNFMLVLGLLHGVVIWFGDILARYALAGYLLKKHIGKGPRALLKPLRFWGLATIVVTFVSAILSSFAPPPDVEMNKVMLSELMSTFQRYADAGYLETIKPRLGDYGLVLFSWLLIFPQAVFLFLIGAIVAQLGWLKNPLRHRLKLQRICWVSLAVGIPISLVFARHGLTASSDPSVFPDFFVSMAMGLSPLLTPAYIAAFAIASTTRFGNAVITTLAPMGNLALSNYLLQSILMSVLLAGYGLGLADRGQFAIALFAIAIYITQLIASHLYLRHYRQGPMEAVWRRYTYKQ